MRQSKKLAVLAATAVTAALALTGCSAGTSGASGDSKTLSLWVPAGTATIAPYVASFNAAHKAEGYKVTVREIPFASYDTALGQAFSAGQGPDLAQINGTSMPSFAEKGYLQDITKIVGTSGNVATSNFYPNLLDAAKFDGKQVSIPIDTGTRVIQYNKKLFAKAGVKDFGDTATYPEILDAAKKIQALGSGYQGFCYVGGVKEYTYLSNLGPFVIGSGGTFVSADGKTATLTSPETIAGVTFFKDLALTGAKSDIVSTASTPCVEGLGKGTVGMQFDGFWDIPSGATATSNFELGQTLPEGKVTYSSTGGWVLGVPTYVKSDKTKILKAFVNDMYKPTNLVKFTGLMPATKSGRDAATGLKDPKYDLYWKILNDNAYYPIPLSTKLPEQGNLLTTATQSILQGTDSVKDALTKANTAFQATLTN